MICLRTNLLGLNLLFFLQKYMNTGTNCSYIFYFLLDLGSLTHCQQCCLQPSFQYSSRPRNFLYQGKLAIVTAIRLHAAYVENAKPCPCVNEKTLWSAVTYVSYFNVRCFVNRFCVHWCICHPITCTTIFLFRKAIADLIPS